MHKQFLQVAFLSAILSVLGCGGEGGLGQVTGVVKLDDKPLPDASVEFTPLDGKGLTSYGKTDSTGAYYMMATRSDKGAAVGKNKVRVTTHDIHDNGGTLTNIPEKVPTKYNQATELEVDVQSGSNTFDFDLKTAGGKVVTKKAGPQDQ